MLTIFDCDGVLIDSEIISAEVLSAVLTAAGWAITPMSPRTKPTCWLRVIQPL